MERKQDVWKFLIIGVTYVFLIILLHIYLRSTSDFSFLHLGMEILFLLLMTSAFVFYFFRKMKKMKKSLQVLLREINSIEDGQEIHRYQSGFLEADASVALEKIRTRFRGLNAKNEKLLRVLEDLEEKRKIILQVVENLPLGFAVSNLVDKRILVANKELTEIYGFRPDYLDELNICHLFRQEEEIAKEKGYPQGVSPADILMPEEKRGQIIFNRKGHYQTVDLKRIPFKKDGFLVTLVSNVSELTEKEEELAANERLSQLIFDTAEVGLAMVDENGNFVKVNKIFCSIYLYRKEELIGKHFTILLPPEKREQARQAYDKKMAKFASQSTALQEEQVINRRGDVLDILTTSRSVFDNHFKGTIYSVLDVTEIRTEHGKMQAAVEGGRLGTWNIDLETGKNEINQNWAEMLGYEKTEVSADLDFFQSLIHPEEVPDFLKELDKIKRGEQSSFHRELRLRCKDGSYKWILDSGKVIKKNLQGEPVLMAGCHVDIDKMKKTQLELISHSNRLQRAQEMGMMGDWEMEMETGSFSCSSMIFRIFGIKEETKFSFDRFLELFEKSTVEHLRKNLQDTANFRNIFSDEVKIFWENGTSRYLKILAVPIFNHSGEVVKVSGILQDITGIRTTRETLKETTKRLQVLSDNIPGGLLQFRISEFYPPKVLYLSRGAEKSLGISRDQVLEGDMAAIFQNIHPNDHNVIKRSLQVASKRLERVNITWRTLSASGEVNWFQGIAIPARNEDNSITWNALVLDITDRKISENKIREQEEYMQVLTQHASDAIIACDQFGKIRFGNDTLQEWLDPFDYTIPPEEWPPFYHLYSIEDDRLLNHSELSLFRALRTGKVINQEFLIKHPRKKVRYVQSNGSALYDSSGNKIGAMVVLRDISERVQKETEVSNAIINAREKERAKIAAEIHDGITQSLSVVAMNMKNLRFDYKELETSDNYAKALNYLQSVISQSRALAHEIMPNSIQDFGLVEAVRELVEQCSLGSREKISFEFKGYGRLSPAKELHIFRVIQEGLGNAMKHSKASSIEIRLQFRKDHIRVSLKDNGKGFDAGRSYLQQGIGLLSMRDRVKKLKGRFRIFSGEKGTLVWLKVPVKKYREENEKTYTDFYS